jgi:mannan endo-1,6-alpha-mannosidase
MIGAELFPGQTMTGGITYLKLAQNTYDEVWEQWDESNCGGGIYWSRDRITPDPKRQFFKSSITHGQQLLLGARLFALTKDRKYLDHAERMYRWLKQGIITREWDVYDGVNLVNGQCALFNDIHSYNSGLMAGAFAYWFQATNDVKWISDADNIMKRALTQFTLNGVVTDPCEAIRQPAKRCPINQVYFKGILLRGMGYVFRFTRDQQLKNSIQQTLDATAKAMFPLCDNNFVCNTQDWAAGRAETAKNVHAQINAMELVNAMLTINTAGLQKVSAPTAAPPSDTLDQLGSASSSFLRVTSILALVSTIFIF